MSFDVVARLEAIWSVTDEQIQHFRKRLANPAIWKIRNDWQGVGVFFYTDNELNRSVDEAFKAKCAKAYADILSPYDQFGYLKEKPASVTFSSKETFERDYQGNWLYYDKR
jgi:hypothetical protein